MQNAPTRTVFDVITDFLADEPSPQEILAFHLPNDLQERAHHLLDLNREDQLTPEQQQEMEEFIKADDMMGLLKAKVKLKLKRQSE